MKYIVLFNLLFIQHFLIYAQEPKDSVEISVNNHFGKYILETTYSCENYLISTKYEKISAVLALKYDKDFLDGLSGNCGDYSTFNSENIHIRSFKTATEDTIDCIIIFHGNRKKTKTIVGYLEIYPSNNLKVDIPVIQLIGLLNRTRINSDDNSQPIDYCVYGFQKGNLIWSVLLSL